MSKTNPSLEELIARLEAIEAYFQQPTMNVEEAIKMHAEALEVAKQAQTYLTEAEQRLTKIDIASLRSEKGEA